MDNEEDEWVEVLKRSGLEGKHFEAKGVSRGEFEALKRFGVYKQLVDGTLMRIEGDKEYRIYCEDAEGWPVRVMTRVFATCSRRYMIARTERSENALSKFARDIFEATPGMEFLGQAVASVCVS
jgi:hypothetical protein